MTDEDERDDIVADRDDIGPGWFRGKHLSRAGEHLPPAWCFGCEIERLEAELAQRDRVIDDLRRQLEEAGRPAGKGWWQ